MVSVATIVMLVITLRQMLQANHVYVRVISKLFLFAINARALFHCPAYFGELSHTKTNPNIPTRTLNDIQCSQYGNTNVRFYERDRSVRNLLQDSQTQAHSITHTATNKKLKTTHRAPQRNHEFFLATL